METWEKKSRAGEILVAPDECLCFLCTVTVLPNIDTCYHVLWLVGNYLCAASEKN